MQTATELAITGKNGIVATETGDNDHKPRGAEQIRSAVIAAAMDLFSQRGYEAVSVREIAARAGVQHSLVHRHFGTKENLLREVIDARVAVLREELREEADPVSGAKSLFDFLLDHGGFVRIGAWSLMSGVPPREMQETFPTVQYLVDLLRKQGVGDDDPDARVVASAAVAMIAGYQIFEEWLRAAARLEGAPREELREGVRDLLGEMVAHAAGSDA